VQTTISVRSEARRTVPPDVATIHAGISVVAGSKQDAMSRAGEVQDRLAAALSALGGVRLTPDARREALTWSSHGMSSYDEHDVNKETGFHGPTGRTVVDVGVQIAVRALDRLDAIGNALAGIDRLSVHAVSWSVDDDNPAWPGLRSEAITAAVDKARHYAAALGGVLTSIEHVADVGLLDGGGQWSPVSALRASKEMSTSADMSGGASLDPVPQELVAAVDARCVARADDLIS